MKTFIQRNFVFILLLLSIPVYGQLKYSGAYMGSAYTFENQPEDTRWDYYNNFQLRAALESYSNLYLNTYFRIAFRGEPRKTDDRFFNLYLHWKPKNQNFYFRLGRQFIYYGVS